MAEEEPLKGCCLSMCPPAEMRLRQREKLVHILECRAPVSASAAQYAQSSGRGQKKAPLQGDPQCFVKEFARCSAGRQIEASQVRPLPVLVRTLKYLLVDVCERTDCPAHCVHEFVCNRLRAVRQDLAVQGLLSSLRSAPLLAACTRYYTLHQYRMCEHPVEDFDPFLNMKQLQECIACVVRLFKDEQSPNTENQQPQFTFDLEDDEDEFLRVDDSSSDGSSPATDDVGSLDHSDGGDNTRENNSESPGVAELVLDSNRLQDQYCSTNSQQSSTSCYGGQQEQQEVDEVLHRIANLDIDAVGGVAHQQHSQQQQQTHSNKDEKNKENQTLLEQDQKDSNCSEDFSNGTDVRWTNIRSCSENDNKPEPSDCRKTPVNQSKLTSIISYSEREEMECLYLLLNYDNSEVLEHVLHLPSNISSGSLFSTIQPAVLSYHNSGNYIPLLKLFDTLPSILCCALYFNLPKLQKRALQVLNTGHSSPNTRYPLSDLSSQLVLPDLSAARGLCRHYGLRITGDQSQFVAFAKKDFNLDACVEPVRRVGWLDSKLDRERSGALLLPHPLALH